MEQIEIALRKFDVLANVGQSFNNAFKVELFYTFRPFDNAIYTFNFQRLRKMLDRAGVYDSFKLVKARKPNTVALKFPRPLTESEENKLNSADVHKMLADLQ